MSKARTALTAAVVVVLVLAALGGVRAVFVASRRAAVPYSTAQVTRGTLVVTVDGTGTLQPRARQDAVTASGGLVREVRVRPGDTVEAGQVLLVLENDSLADQVEALRLELRLAEIDLETMTRPGESLATAAEIAAARAAVEAARLSAELARRNVEALAASAPFAGRISGLGARVGDTLPPGTPLFTVATCDRFTAALLVPETDVRYVSVDDPVTVTVLPISRDLAGQVRSISAQGLPGDRGSVLFQVAVDLDDADPLARGGMSVTGRIATGESPPHDAVTAHGALAYARLEAVVSPTGGTVTAVLAAEDEVVPAGRTILVLESDEALAALAGAEADLARAEEALRQATNPGPPAFTQAQIEKQRLRVSAAELQLAALERQLADLTVRAELAGTVTDVPVSPGDEVPAGSRLVSVADLSVVVAVITVDELEVASLTPGQPATIRLDALPGETFSATLETVSLEGALREGVTSYQARLTCAGDPRMRSGMSLSASIEVARRENVLLVPAEAVYGAGRQATVQVLSDGRPESREVTAGPSDGTFTEIVEGLVEGETVITGSLEPPANPFGPTSQAGHPGSGGGE